MSRRPGVYGPYRHGNRYRIVTVNAEGAQHVESCSTEKEARQLKRDADRLLDQKARITVRAAIDEYELAMRAKGNKERSIDTTLSRLNAYFGESIDRALGTMTSRACGDLYGAMVGVVSVDTHRNTLNQARTFFKWCVSRHYIARNPLLEVVGTGKRKRGKPQLRIDEARKWTAKAVERGAAGDVAALAALTALLFGMRASEVCSRQVRDLDDGGRLLWIPDAKTEAGKRWLEVPEAIRPLLLELAKDKRPDARLFGDMTRHALLRKVQKLCTEVNVPVVCAHAMRGLHSTLAIEAGTTGHIVAASLGHTSFAITEAHYVDRDRAAKAKQRVAMRVLDGGRK